MKKIFLSFATLAMIFASCEKEPLSDDINASSDDLTSSEMIVNEDATIEDAMETTDYEVDFFTGSEENLDATFAEVESGTLKHGPIDRRRLRYLYGQAPRVTIDTAEAGYPITITLDYGDSTVLVNGKVLKGKIIITLTAPPRTDGAERRTEYVDFFIDSIGVEGYSSHVIDISEEDPPTIAFELTRDLTFTFYDETTIICQARKRREWISGITTPFDLSDDTIHITGTASLTSRDGIEYQKEITSTLVKLGTCKFIVSGTVEFSIDGETTMILDYGDGECDNIAMVFRNGERKLIRIGKMWNRNRRRSRE